MTPRPAPIPAILRRGLAIVAILAIMVGGVTLTATDNSLPTVFTLPGATAEPTGPPGPTGPGPGSGSGGSQFQPPDMGSIDGGYSGGNYPAPPQGNGIDINNPSAAPGYDQAPQYPQQQQPYPSRQPPVHGTQPPDYDAPPQQQAPTQQPAQQEPQEPAQQEAAQPSSAPGNDQDQALRDLQRHCEDIAQQLGITEQVMVLPANLPSGDLRNAPGRSVGGGVGACGICPPQQGPQNSGLPERPIR